MSSFDWPATGSGGAGSSTFLGLSDTPSVFTAQALKVARVNAGETAVEFATIAGTGDVVAASNFGTDNVLVRSDGVNKGVQATGIAVADTTNNVSGVGTIASGALSPSNLTASRALQASAGGVVESSAVTATELGYVSGVSSAIQTQLNAKGDASDPGSSTDNTLPRFDGTGGKTLQGSGVVVDDTNNVSGVGTLNTHTIQGGTGTLALTSDITGTNSGTNTGDQTFDGLSPMTTGGDIIYGGASGTGTRLANGTTGQVLTSAGGTAAPTWATPGGGSGDVTAATSFGTDNVLVRSDGTGKGVQASAISVDDSDNVTGVTTIDVDGTTESTSATTGVVKAAGGISAQKNIVAGGQIGGIINDVGASGTTKTIDWNDANVQFVDMTGNVTFTLSNPISGFAYTLVLKQDATGSRTATWPAAVLWPGGTAPTLSTAANSIDLVTLVYSALDTQYYAVSQLAFS